MKESEETFSKFPQRLGEAKVAKPPQDGRLNDKMDDITPLHANGWDFRRKWKNKTARRAVFKGPKREWTLRLGQVDGEELAMILEKTKTGTNKGRRPL